MLPPSAILYCAYETPLLLESQCTKTKIKYEETSTAKQDQVRLKKKKLVKTMWMYPETKSIQTDMTDFVINVKFECEYDTNYYPTFAQ